LADITADTKEAMRGDDESANFLLEQMTAADRMLARSR
jgi:hypothetical protein